MDIIKMKTIVHNVSFVVVVALMASLSEGQVLQFGKCADIETMRFFELEKFLGKWYEIKRFPTWYEDYGQCAYKTIQNCGKRIEIQHGFIRDGIQYVLHVDSTYTAGDDAVFYINENSIDPIGIPMAVISTDYDNFAVIYGCKDSETVGIKYTLAWILSRNTTITSADTEKAYKILNSLPNASTAYLEPVIHNEENCKFYWTAHVNSTDTGN